MNPIDLLNAFQHTPWLAALALVGMLLRAWVTDKSDFPITLPPAWQPVITAASVGVLNAVASAKAGVPVESIVMTTAAWAGSTGFLDGVLIAIFGDPTKAPKWARVIVWIYDRVEGGGSSSGGGGGVAPVAAAKVGFPIVPPGRDQRGEFRGMQMGRFLLRPALLAPGVALSILITSIVATGPACTKAETQQVVTDVEEGITEFVTYVNTFLPLAEATWATISPYLGATANAQFNNAVVAVEDASGALQDAVRGANAATEDGGPNIAELIGAVQDGIAKILAIVHQYAGTTDAGSIGGSVTVPAALDREGRAIAGWRK